MHTKCLPENLQGRNHLRNLGVGGRIKSKWNLRKGCEDVSWIHRLRIGTALVSYEHGNKTWGCAMKLTSSVRHQPRAGEPEAKRRGCGLIRATAQLREW